MTTPDTLLPILPDTIDGTTPIAPVVPTYADDAWYNMPPTLFPGDHIYEGMILSKKYGLGMVHLVSVPELNTLPDSPAGDDSNPVPQRNTVRRTACGVRVADGRTSITLKDGDSPYNCNRCESWVTYYRDKAAIDTWRAERQPTVIEYDLAMNPSLDSSALADFEKRLNETYYSGLIEAIWYGPVDFRGRPNTQQGLHRPGTGILRYFDDTTLALLQEDERLGRKEPRYPRQPGAGRGY